MSGQAEAKRGRRPTAVDTEEVATILAYAKLHGIPKAAEQYDVSKRSIGRWRASVRDGKQPEVAALVAKESAAAVQRNRDLICDTVDQLLKELQDRKAKLSNAELIEAVEKVGQLRVTRDALSPHGESPDADQPSPRPAEGTGSDAGGEIRPAGSSSAGAPGDPDARVH